MTTNRSPHDAELFSIMGVMLDDIDIMPTSSGLLDPGFLMKLRSYIVPGKSLVSESEIGDLAVFLFSKTGRESKPENEWKNLATRVTNGIMVA